MVLGPPTLLTHLVKSANVHGRVGDRRHLAGESERKRFFGFFHV